MPTLHIAMQFSRRRHRRDAYATKWDEIVLTFSVQIALPQGSGKSITEIDDRGSSKGGRQPTSVQDLRLVVSLTDDLPTPSLRKSLRKEVIQPQVPLRLPCYDFTPVADLTVVGCLLAVSSPASGKTNSHGVTGGVYKARERIHRGMLIRDY